MWAYNGWATDSRVRLSQYAEAKGLISCAGVPGVKSRDGIHGLEMRNRYEMIPQAAGGEGTE